MRRVHIHSHTNGIPLAFWYKQAIKFATDSIERKLRCRTNPCGILDQKKERSKKWERETGKFTYLIFQ